MILFVTSVLLVLIVSFLCSLAEAVLLSLNINSLPRGYDGKETATLKAWKNLKNNIARPIAAILILNTVANTGGATLAGAAFTDIWGHKWLWLFTLLMTLAILSCTEILPKTIGVAYNRFLANYLALPLEKITQILSPLVKATELITNKIKPDPDNNKITSGDVVAMASMARAGKAIGLEQENIIVNTVRLSHTPVSLAMLPRESISYIVNGVSLEKNEERLGGLIHTRYPLCLGDSLDTIVGTINCKKFEHVRGSTASDFLPYSRTLVRIQEDVTLLEALHTMRMNRMHMIIVDDKDGRICGLITLEDITDELVTVELPD